MRSKSSGRERLAHLEVVVEAVLDRGADGESGALEEVENGLGEHMRRGVAENVQTFVAVECDHREIARFVERAAQIPELAVDLYGDRGSGETGPDGLGDLETGGVIGVLDHRSIGITKL